MVGSNILLKCWYMLGFMFEEGVRGNEPAFGEELMQVVT